MVAPQVAVARVAIKKTVVSFIVMSCFEEFVLLIISVNGFLRFKMEVLAVLAKQIGLTKLRFLKITNFGFWKM